ncbi:monocyte chemotactic protein 1B-like [Hypomesus transpacificus]|uniref:monocyte chemotactic protein 1B-like n=1 Tax=Hypomesus transpacificus TaxID=137520 RepID=UPI001F081AF9|nr:monocyte chemotactic protein 1B-like [Hypomesus transpacificus]
MKLACALLLLSISCLLMDTTSAQVNKVGSCCRKTFSMRIPLRMLGSYYVQDIAMCPIKAVVFVTVKDKRLCLDPKELWVKTAIDYLDKKNTSQTRQN